jgi:hypothetical protein
MALAMAAVVLSSAPGTDARVVADARGDAAVVWAAGLSRPRVLLSMRRAGGRFGRPRVVGGGRAPRLGIDAAGDVLVAWQAGHRLRARWASGRGRLSRMQEVDPRGGTSPDVAVSSDGVGVVVWEHQAVWATSGRANRRLGAPQRVSAPAATDPRVAFGADGTLVAAWRGAAGVEVAATAAGRPFGPVQRVSAPVAHDSVGGPEVAVAPDGGTVVAWDQVAHPELPHPIAVAAAWRDPGTLSFSAPQTVSGSPAPVGALRDVAVAAGRGGYGLVVWPADDLMFGTALEYADRARGPFGPQQALDARRNRTAESPAAVVGARGEPIVAWQHSTGVACPGGRTESCYDTGLRPLVAIGSPLSGRAKALAREGVEPSVAAVPGGAIVAWSGDRVTAALVLSR